MEKHIKLLSVLLGVQLLLALGLGLSGPQLAARSEGMPLVEVVQDQIDRITLEGPDQARVLLSKNDGVWLLPGTGDYPADATRVKQLLERLAGLKSGTPVATTTGAHGRFKVSNDNFERRITLAHGEEILTSLYLGTSTGRGRIHARTQDQDAIYAVEFAAYDAPTKSSDWEDKTVLQTPKGEIQAIEVAGLRLERSMPPADAGSESGDKTDERSSATWVAGALEQGKMLKPEAADKLAGLLANLRIGEVLGKGEKAAYGLDKPILEVTLARKGGSNERYRLAKEAQKDSYILKASSRPEYFRLPAYTAKPLIDAAAKEALISTVSTSAESGAAEESNAS